MTEVFQQTAASLIARHDPAAPVAASPAFSLPKWAVEAVDIDTPDHPDFGFNAAQALRRIHPDRRGALNSLAAQVNAALSETRPINPDEIGRALKQIGCRVQPGLGDEAAAGWSASVVAALSRFDAGIVSKAIDAALTAPFKFLNEVHPWLHARCTEALAKRQRVVRRLRQIADAAAPKPEVEPVSSEQIDALVKSLAANAAKERAVFHGKQQDFCARTQHEPARLETIMAAFDCNREEAIERQAAAKTATVRAA